VGNAFPSKDRQYWLKIKTKGVNKQLLDEGFVISVIIKAAVSVISRLKPKAKEDSIHGDLDYFGYHKN